MKSPVHVVPPQKTAGTAATVGTLETEGATATTGMSKTVVSLVSGKPEARRAIAGMPGTVRDTSK